MIGAAMACYDKARQFAMSRVRFDRPIGGFQFVQAKLARTLTEITKFPPALWLLPYDPRVASRRGGGSRHGMRYRQHAGAYTAIVRGNAETIGVGLVAR